MSMVRISLLGTVNIAMVVAAVWLACPVSVYRVDVFFYSDFHSVSIGIDPVFVITLPEMWLATSMLRAAGLTLGDVVVLDVAYANWPCLLQHELNHVLQYRALGEFFPAGELVFNTEGHPYYGGRDVCTGLDYMWKPDPDMMWWHMIYLKVPLK